MTAQKKTFQVTKASQRSGDTRILFNRVRILDENGALYDVQEGMFLKSVMARVMRLFPGITEAKV